MLNNPFLGIFFPEKPFSILLDYDDYVHYVHISSLEITEHILVKKSQHSKIIINENYKSSKEKTSRNTGSLIKQNC